MATIKTLKDKDETIIYPQTTDQAVFDGQGVPLTERLEEVNKLKNRAN